MNRKIRAQARKDRKKKVLEELDKDLDVRDQWLGIKGLKSTCTPIAFCRKDENGKHIPMNQRVEEAAKYLGTKQWAAQADRSSEISKRKITRKAGI